MSNVYYNPRDFGLEIVAEIEYSTGSYEFDTRVIWKDEEGRLWTARDSGCSCPTPFENESLDTLERLVKEEVIAEAIKELNAGANDFIKEVKAL